MFEYKYFSDGSYYLAMAWQKNYMIMIVIKQIDDSFKEINFDDYNFLNVFYQGVTRETNLHINIYFYKISAEYV